MSQSNNLQSKIELRHDYIILKRKNVGKTAFSFRHFPTFYNRHLHHSIVHVLKNELNLENVDDVINMLADNYIENSNEKTEILEEIQAENEYKLKKFEKRKKNKE